MAGVSPAPASRRPPPPSPTSCAHQTQDNGRLPLRLTQDLGRLMPPGALPGHRIRRLGGSRSGRGGLLNGRLLSLPIS